MTETTPFPAPVFTLDDPDTLAGIVAGAIRQTIFNRASARFWSLREQIEAEEEAALDAARTTGTVPDDLLDDLWNAIDYTLVMTKVDVDVAAYQDAYCSDEDDDDCLMAAYAPYEGQTGPVTRDELVRVMCAVLPAVPPDQIAASFTAHDAEYHRRRTEEGTARRSVGQPGQAD